MSPTIKRRVDISSANTALAALGLTPEEVRASVEKNRSLVKTPVVSRKELEEEVVALKNRVRTLETAVQKLVGHTLK